MNKYFISILSLISLATFSYFPLVAQFKKKEKTKTIVKNVDTQKPKLNPPQENNQVSSEKSDIPPPKIESKEITTGEFLTGLKIGGLVRIRPEYRNNFDFNKTADDASDFVGMKTQIYFEKDFTADIKAKVVLQDARIWGGTPGSQTGLNTANDFTRQSIDLREAYIDVKNLIGPINLVVGRQLLKYGDERLVGALDWTNVGRSFDAIRTKYEHKWLSSHAWVSVLSEEDSDIAGNTTEVSRKNSSGLSTICTNNTLPCVTTSTTPNEKDDGYFTGFYNTIKWDDWIHTDFYYLGVYKKWIPRATNQIDYENRARQRDNLHTFGTRWTNRTQEGKKSTTPFDITVEYAIQRGTSGVNTNPNWDIFNTSIPFQDLTGTTTNRRIYREKQGYHSYAYSLDTGYTFFKKLRFGAEYNVGSGDNNRTDGKIRTFNNLFHTNHTFYGEADFISWQNMIGKSLNASYDFGEFGKLRLAAWTFQKQQSQDGYYDVGGAYRAGRTTESFSNQQYLNTSVAQNPNLNLPSANLGRNLFKEYDFIYAFSYKKILWQFGYSIISAGDSFKQVQNEVYTNSLVRTYRFDPNARFLYFMMTAIF